MKYIRTEKGIFEFTDEMCVNQFGHIAYKDRPHICIYGVGNKVIKQANTIEELCDEFVLVEKIREVTYHHKSSKFADFKSIAMLNERYTLHGAIWTDKGLIYVAKMNDKGELELI